MISCAAIQKLERYGQLGQKRRSVEDFVQSSLKDPKRGNVYALTHVPTWRSCLAALTLDDRQQQQQQEEVERKRQLTDDDKDGKKQAHGAEGLEEALVATPAPIFVISDSLLYAISFATALVAHHLDEQRHVAKKSEKGQKKKQTKEDDSAALVGKVFNSRLEEAEELLGLLQAVAEACGRHCHHRNDGSPVVTQALAHLLATAADTVLIAIILRQVDANHMESEVDLLHGLCRNATALVAAAASQLRTARARQPLNTLRDVRPCPTLLNRLLTKTKSTHPTTTSTETKHVANRSPGCLGVQEDKEAIVTSRMVAWAAVANRGSLIALLAPFTLFQKLSLVDAVVAESPASCCCLDVARYRRTLASLVSNTACNRATRLVVYFRGDEIKLMQNNVRDNAEYALHTHVTTPPTEEATLRSVATLPEEQQQHAVLLLVQWMASIPFYYHSFCAEQSWTAFAQEQRRMVLLKESQARRDRREQRRQKAFGNTSSAVDATGRGSSSSITNTNNNNNTDNNDNVYKRDGRGDVSGDTADDDDEDERQSLLSHQSALSLVSRASMISTMSKSSMTSYRTFLSVIDAARNETSHTEDPLHVHQSEDGNTNLPLILLEEITLALQRFMGTASDSGVAAMLERFGLQTLAWRTIGELYAFIQSTITAAAPSSALSFSNNMKMVRSTAVAAEETPAVFHLGHDIRYNKGLGYEVLGLLFAKVVLPQLPTARSEPQVAQRYVEPAITRCLFAYEVIAPQVIDQNVSAILCIAAHVAMEAPSQKMKGDINTSAAGLATNMMMLHEFIISLVTRLGKSNQIPMLLDAVVSHVKKEGGTIQAVDTHGEDLMVAGLHEIFSNLRVREALVQACGVSLDPEELLIHLLKYVSRWASEEDEDEDEDEAEAEADSGKEFPKARATSTKLSQLLPQKVLFILDVVATVIEGILATSITAIALLQRAAELELTLSAFLVNRLHKTFFAGMATEAEEDGKPQAEKGGNSVEALSSSSPFAGGEGSVRPKMLRRLVLYTLHAIYQARELIFACLRDLGIQNVEAYLRMMEETMWQVQTNVGALVGPLSIEELDAMMSFTTQMRHAPYVHRATLLPQLVLQRLTLAQSVSVALNVAVEPLTEARRLTTFVLCHLRFVSDGGYLPDGETARALELANRLTEEEWGCILQFGRPKRVRRALVWLLRVTFAASPTAWRSASWLTRCLTSCAGFLLEALCEVIMVVTDDEVCACCYNHTKVDGREEAEEEELLLQLCAALGDVLRRLGHIPQWPALLQRAVHWLLLIQTGSTTLEEEEENMNRKNNKRMRTCLLERRLLQLIADFLSCEDGVQSLLRRILLRPDESHVVSRASRKAGREKSTVVNDAFVRAIGVPFIPSAAILEINVSPLDKRNNEQEDGSDTEDKEEAEGNDSEMMTKRTAAVCNLLVHQMFSKEFAVVLIRHSEDNAMAPCAAGILRQLYTTALHVCYGERNVTASPSRAHTFALSVVEEMCRCCCNTGNFTALSSFLSAMSNGPIALGRAASKEVSAEEPRRKRPRPEAKGEGLLATTNVAAFAVSDCYRDDGEAVQHKNSHHDTAEEQPLHEVSLRWMELLGKLFLQVVQSITTETNEHLLHVFTALYMSLERVRGYTIISQGSKKQPHQDQQQEEHSDRRFGCSLASAAMASPGVSRAYGEVCRLFAPTDEKTRRNSLVTLARLLSSESDSALRALWVLFLVQEGRQRSMVAGKEGHATKKECDCWLAALLSNFDPRQDYGACDAVMNELLVATESWMTGGRRGAQGFKLVALQREAVYLTDAATQWMLQQMRVMPSIIHAFPTDGAPVLLQEYMHALLHEAIPSSYSSSIACSFSSSFTSPAGFAAQCLSRYGQLLRAACKSLHQLSMVPHMRFSAWRGDVKRLLVASGTNALLNSDSKALWCQVLELCALPLPAFHENDAFIDHELSFIHALLVGSSDEHHLEEAMLLRVLRVFTRTLLPLGVLWRRTHLLPALMSALLTRFLDSVARGHSGRVVLNQLSSFFFQLVKDASHGGNSNRHSGFHTSPSVKMLCLASITSCLFRQSVAYIDVFTTHSSDLDFLAVDFLKALQRIHLPRRNTSSAWRQERPVWSDATLCDLSYASVGNDDGQSLLRQAAERVEEEEGNGDRKIFIVPT
ncbi:hypothetical protein TraAM80_06267 [Trypanosoma rangeli]|uniref:Uncharacterized protein n=1 Tax=Trypanosoma rangeli TaxID=5698 RepID=A0A3R7RHF7_TRYRA|nr:uncharacterized protein TraAM80_06267 [Trypanosoma rangeli]RNF02752.1 hypothetical protein TraAM80_06267 [Trypanosoma rangeli]|eukprot:RNF02752.1 hypothetical protein TraAM80_06267 [Trypanosoma rangeli]